MLSMERLRTSIFLAMVALCIYVAMVYSPSRSHHHGALSLPNATLGGLTAAFMGVRFNITVIDSPKEEKRRDDAGPLSLEYLNRLIPTSTWNTATANVRYTPLINCSSSPMDAPQPLHGNVKLNYESVVSRLMGKSILFLGDSNTRYQYINLAQYIQTSKWVSENRPQSEWEKSFGGWANFYNVTSRRLHYEVCDCYREPSVDVPRTRENRYYRNPVLNINLTMIVQLGQVPVEAHTLEALQISCWVGQGCNATIPQQTPLVGGSAMPRVVGVDAWIHFVCLFKPDVFIVNMGHWINMNNESSSLQRAGERIQECNGGRTQLIFRSTFPRCALSKRPEHPEPKIQAFVESPAGKALGWQWLDIYSHLRHVKCNRRVFHDDIHLKTSVISLVNRMMLVQLLGPTILNGTNPCSPL